MNDLTRELTLSWALDPGLQELSKALYGPEVTIADVADDLLGDENPVSKAYDSREEISKAAPKVSFNPQVHPRDAEGKFASRNHEKAVGIAELAAAGALFALTAHFGHGIRTGVTGLRSSRGKIKQAEKAYQYTSGIGSRVQDAAEALNIPQEDLVKHIEAMRKAGLAYTPEQAKALLAAPANAKAFSDMAKEHAAVFEGAAQQQKENIDKYLLERRHHLGRILRSSAGAVVAGGASSLLTQASRANLKKRLEDAREEVITDAINKGYFLEDAQEKADQAVVELMKALNLNLSPGARRLAFGSLAVGGLMGAGEAATGYRAMKHEKQGKPLPYRPALGAAAIANAGSGGVQAGWEGRKAVRELASGRRAEAGLLGVAAGSEAIGSVGSGVYGADQVHQAHKEGRHFTGDALQQGKDVGEGIKQAWHSASNEPSAQSHSVMQVAREHSHARSGGSGAGPISRIGSTEDTLHAAKNAIKPPKSKKQPLKKRFFQEYLIWKAGVFNEQEHKRDPGGKFTYRQMNAALKELPRKERYSAYLEGAKNARNDPEWKSHYHREVAGNLTSLGGVGGAVGGVIQGGKLATRAHDMNDEARVKMSHARDLGHGAVNERMAERYHDRHAITSGQPEVLPKGQKKAMGTPAEETFARAKGMADSAFEETARAAKLARASRVVGLGGAGLGIAAAAGGVTYEQHHANARVQIERKHIIDAAKRRKGQ